MPARTRTSRALPTLTPELVHHTLANGLRVVLAPDRSAPVVGVAVLYDVGIRSEPEGRTGFAHLFEHLMFQGSASLGKMEHARYVQSAGGVFNGSTHFDYTDYFEAMPANALERALFLEADRMASPRITAENLANQISVVKEEIRVNVLNRPYGGFPWLILPGVLYETFANSHNGYGSFVDLDGATEQDAASFFDRYYAPGNAVLSVAGDFDADDALALIETHFSRVPARPVPVRPDFAEPAPQGEKRLRVNDAHAPIPAVALGYRVPAPHDPDGGFAREFLAAALLVEILSDGDSSRLHHALVQGGIATDVSAYLGEFGDPFDERDPTPLTISVFYPRHDQLDTVLATVDQELARLAADGPAPGELDRVRTKFVASLLRDLDAVINRTLTYAKFELLHGGAEKVADLPARFGELTDDDVRRAAAGLRADSRAVVDLVPAGSDNPTEATA